MRRFIIAAGALLAASVATAPPAAAQIQGLEIIAPASPGGGWDQTARAMQSALQDAGLAQDVQVMNIPGAGGTIGLAQFVTSKEGEGDTLLVSGLVMLGSILTNDAPVTIDQTTPIARLIGEYEVIVVPASSEIQTLDDLIAALKEDPGAVSWAGGSAGGVDHILVGLIAKAAGVDPTQINYVPFSGGGEALASLLGGHVTAGVSGYAEWAGQIEAGELRALAVSGAERMEGIDVPTLQEQGVDIELVNWRAVLAPPGISDEDKKALGDAVGPDGRERGLAGHPRGARLARPLHAARRVRPVPRGGPATGRGRAQGHRPGAVVGRTGRPRAMTTARGLRAGRGDPRRVRPPARPVRRRRDGDAAVPGRATPRSAPSCSRGWSRPGCCWSASALLREARSGAVAHPGGFELDAPAAAR